MYTKFALPRCLTFAALAVGLAAIPARAEDDPQKLAQEMEAAYRAGQYDKALTLGEKLHKIDEDNPTHMYNLACLSCLLGKKDKAYEWLDKAVDAGWKEADQLANDGDFKTIRGEDRFRAIVSKVRGANAPKADKKVEKKKPKKDDDEEDGDDDEDDEDHADKKPAKVEKKSPAKKEAKDEDEDEDEEDDAADKSEQVQELTQQLIAAAEAKEYDRALKIALKAQKIADVGLTNYNVACMYSLTGNKDKAFEYLERAIKKGDFPQSITDQMEGDSDLDSIRKDARYKKMLELAKGGKAKGGERRAGGGEMQKAEFKWKVTLPKKHDAEEKTPLIVVLHGAGGNMNEAATTWKKAADKAGAILLTPQGTMKQGEGFNWGHDTDAVEENVMMAIDKVAGEHKIDKSRIVLAGFSQGAMMTWGLALRNPDTFCGIIPVAGRCDAKSDSAFEDADLAKLKVYTILGDNDKADMLKSAKDAAKKLEKKGAKVKVAEFEDLGHAYPENADVELGKALKFVMGD